MIPNGRRAWRKWVRRQDLRRKHKQPKGSICRMARQARRHIPLVPGVVPPKPFTTRSLVGMTMGARKRAAYYEALRSSYDGDGGPISNRKLRLCLRTALLTPEVLSDSVPLDYRLDVRAKYRIGQRLRPCPGCPECEHGKCWRCANCGTTKGLCDLTLAEVRCKCGKGCGLWRISFPATTVCNGSGVLPARHQLCLGCSWCGTPPKEDATRFTECDGSGVLPARRS